MIGSSFELIREDVFMVVTDQDLQQVIHTLGLPQGRVMAVEVGECERCNDAVKGGPIIPAS